MLYPGPGLGIRKDELPSRRDSEGDVFVTGIQGEGRLRADGQVTEALRIRRYQRAQVPWAGMKIEHLCSVLSPLTS